MWTMTVPVLSTSHIRQDTFKQIRDVAEVLEYQEGAFIHVSAWWEPLLKAAPELRPIARWHVKNFPDETWIRFDCDGDNIEGLPVYEW